jgi:tetratricopeptide (TPR) repeat protein
MALAEAIILYNLDRYPQRSVPSHSCSGLPADIPPSVIFLFFQGRLYAKKTQAGLAVKAFQAGIKVQREYIQLQHLCYWDLGLVSLAIGDYKKSYEAFNILEKESNWSRAIYSYAKAVSLYEEGKDPARAAKMMKGVPSLIQRIAGKTVPLEVSPLPPSPPSCTHPDMFPEICRETSSQVHGPGQLPHPRRSRTLLRPLLPLLRPSRRPLRTTPHGCELRSL